MFSDSKPLFAALSNEDSSAHSLVVPWSGQGPILPSYSSVAQWSPFTVFHQALDFCHLWFHTYYPLLDSPWRSADLHIALTSSSVI